MMLQQTWNGVRVNKKENLNALVYQTDGDPGLDNTPIDNSIAAIPADVSVYFRDLDEHLITHIEMSRMVVGCVAWLTNVGILKALSKVPSGASIVVQKEDFLRPDAYDSNSWKAQLRKMYSEIKFGLTRYECPTPLHNMSVCCDPSIEGVRCMGMYSRSKAPDVPRMHNKFLVFCDTWEETIKHEYIDEFSGEKCMEEEIVTALSPYAVWSGSFNFTANATISLENAIYIKSTEIARAYLNEWAQILALSEPLDWDSDYVSPEWRIGT